jgi:DNA-binding MurR/RpiR family transcriptional regulator
MFRDRIRAKYRELTPSFRKLADFILQEPLDAAFMTATEMADRMDVDAATVVRFAQTLGYSGFRQLIKEIQRVVKAELTAAYSADLEISDDAGLLRSLLENERHNLALAQTRLTEKANDLLPMLLDGQRIWVLGQGSGAHLAALCASTLREIGLTAIAIASDPPTAAADLKQVGADDVVIGISITGMDLNVGDAISFARRRGAKTLAFSGSAITAAALTAETAIVCPGPTQTSVPSFVGLAAMIVALAGAFAARYPERTAAAMENLRQSYRELLEIQSHSSSQVNLDELWRQF